MAATKFSCPECGKVLRPAKPLPAGKRVKCPQCSAMFETRDDELSTPASVAKTGAKGTAKAGAKSKPKPAAKPAAKPKAAKKTEDAKPPADTIPLKDGDDDEDGGPATYGYLDGHDKDDEPDIEYAPDTSIKDLRGPAQAAVMKPSNYMIMWSVIGILCYLLFSMVILIPVIFPNPPDTSNKPAPPITAAQKKPVYDTALWIGGAVQTTLMKTDAPPGPGTAPSSPPPLEKEEEPAGSMFMILEWDLMTVPEWPAWKITLLLLSCVLGMLYCAVTIYGAVQMQTLTSRIWGMVSAILVMFPAISMGTLAILSIILTFGMDILMDRDSMIWVFPLWIAMSCGPNLGFGIWGLITLMRPDVIDGYEYVPE